MTFQIAVEVIGIAMAEVEIGLVAKSQGIAQREITLTGAI